MCDNHLVALMRENEDKKCCKGCSGRLFEMQLSGVVTYLQKHSLCLYKDTFQDFINLYFNWNKIHAVYFSIDQIGISHLGSAVHESWLCSG